MNAPTSEQQAVVDSKARVRVVQAVPGSGKTWLVANLIKKALEQRQTNSDGIAALSFTRVGGDEIRRAIGYDLCHPHFVGTLDSFLFRFVVRPFLKKVFPQCAEPRLIPAEWEPNEWRKGAGGTNFTVPVGTGENVRIFNLFNVCFIGDDEGKPVIACKQWDWDQIVPLDVQARDAVLSAKREIWKKYGWLTHSDAAFLASKILGDQTHGKTVRTELLRRFGLIMIDELQDTGWFLGQCVMQLLAEPTATGVLVGDPDQAIYEFNGARPDLFDRFTFLDGSEQLSLGRTRRCSSIICKVAENLAPLGRRIEPALGRTGRAFLLSYNDFEGDIQKLRKWLENRTGNGTAKIVARHTKTVRMIAGLTVKEAPKLGSVPLNHLHRSVNTFRQGRQVAALVAARAALEYAIFDHEDVTQDELAESGVDSAAWKRLCVEAILEANVEITDETFGVWGKRIADFLQERFAKIIPLNPDGSGTKKIRLPTGQAKCEPRQKYLITTAAGLLRESNIFVQTIHAVKGETHDLTVLVCPERQESQCPSAVWWSDAASVKEERRIAFVAVTRTRGDLVVCVSENSFARLHSCRTEFFQTFERMSIDEFIAANDGAMRKNIVGDSALGDPQLN